MRIESTYRVEILYIALSLIAVYGIYTDSKSVWVGTIFFIIFCILGVVFAYIQRVKSVDINDKSIVLNKIGREICIEKGEIRRLLRSPIGNGVFHIWFTNGTKDIFIPPLAYRKSDLNIIETNLRRMIVL